MSEMRKNFAPNFAHLFRTKLGVYLCQNDANANFKNDFRNWKKVGFIKV